MKNVLLRSNNNSMYTNFLHRVTVYVNQLGTWYDSKGHTEVLSSSVMAKVESSISTAGLTGVDKLLAFLIVQELQVCHTTNLFTFVPLP